MRPNNLNLGFPDGLSVIGEYKYHGKAGIAFSYGSNGISGTGRADMNPFSVRGMIRF